MDELIPETVKPLYERLINEGAIGTPDADPVLDERARTAIAAGLAGYSLSTQRLVSGVNPVVVLEQVLTRWRDSADSLAERFGTVAATNVRLQEASVRARTAFTGTARCQIITDRYHVEVLVNALMTAAQRDVSAWNTGPYLEPVPERPEGSDLESLYIEPDARLIARGGRTRAVVDPSFLEQPGALANLRAGAKAGEENRVCARPLPMKLLLIDDHTALVPLGPYGRPALLIRCRPLVAVFRYFFELVWNAALAWAEPPNPREEDGKQSLRHRILDTAAAGLKDEAIARHCGVSARTVRRHMADIEAELGAGNRFAAGVAAVRRGWIR